MTEVCTEASHPPPHQFATHVVTYSAAQIIRAWHFIHRHIIGLRAKYRSMILSLKLLLRLLVKLFLVRLYTGGYVVMIFQCSIV